jgi:hypothetical protein
MIGVQDMKPTLLLLLLSTVTLLSYAGPARAQAAPPAADPAAVPPASAGPPYGAQQLPETRGTVERFTLTPRGDLDGFLLADETEVHVPPHLSAQLAAAVRAGDPVSVRGYRSSSPALVVAVAVADLSTNQTAVDRGPPPPGFGPPSPLPPGIPTPGAQQASLSGKVQTPLYGPRGDLNGAILDDGTIVRVPPPAAYQWASLLAPGQTISVQGWALSTAYGRVVDAQAIGPAIPQPGGAEIGTPPVPPNPRR